MGEQKYLGKGIEGEQKQDLTDMLLKGLANTLVSRSRDA